MGPWVLLHVAQLQVWTHNYVSIPVLFTMHAIRYVAWSRRFVFCWQPLSVLELWFQPNHAIGIQLTRIEGFWTFRENIYHCIDYDMPGVRIGHSWIEMRLTRPWSQIHLKHPVRQSEVPHCCSDWLNQSMLIVHLLVWHGPPHRVCRSHLNHLSKCDTKRRPASANQSWTCIDSSRLHMERHMFRSRERMTSAFLL